MITRALFMATLVAAGLISFGCKGTDPGAEEAKQVLSGPPKRTPEEMAKTAARMKTMKDQADADRQKFIQQNPDTIAKINEARASAGMPAFGQEPGSKH